jgi:hypothetical protein
MPHNENAPQIVIRPSVYQPTRPAGEGELKHRKGESSGKFGILAGVIHGHAHENKYKTKKEADI